MAHAPSTTGSSRGTGNETNYVVMQKFARAVLNTNNVDCCARVCQPRRRATAGAGQRGDEQLD